MLPEHAGEYQTIKKLLHYCRETVRFKIGVSNAGE